MDHCDFENDRIIMQRSEQAGAQSAELLPGLLHDFSLQSWAGKRGLRHVAPLTQLHLLLDLSWSTEDGSGIEYHPRFFGKTIYNLLFSKHSLNVLCPCSATHV